MAAGMAARPPRFLSVFGLLVCIASAAAFTGARDKDDGDVTAASATDGRSSATGDSPTEWEWDEDFAKAVAMHQGVFRCGDREALASWTCACCESGVVKDFRVQDVVTDTKKTLISIVGYSPVFRAAVVMFRGTCPKAFQNWLSDLNISKLDVNFPGVPDAKIHSGFMHAYNATALRPGIHKALEKLFRDEGVRIGGGGQGDGGSPRLLVTGHSLGGAMGTLAALDLQQTFGLSAKDVRVVTMGSPRVGNHAFAEYYHSQVPQTTRLVNGRDIVPTLPPARTGFYHVPSEVWIYHMNPDRGRQVIFEPVICQNAFVNNTRDDCRTAVRCISVKYCPFVFAGIVVFGVPKGLCDSSPDELVAFA